MWNLDFAAALGKRRCAQRKFTVPAAPSPEAKGAPLRGSLLGKRPSLMGASAPTVGIGDGF